MEPHASRGQSLSVLMLVATTALFLMVGLVVDGGQRVTATRRAVAVADQAARAATDAAAASRLEGVSYTAAAEDAAREVLAAHPDVTGSVSVGAGTVTVTTRTESDTIFLSLIGLRRVVGEGRAAADLVRLG